MLILAGCNPQAADENVRSVLRTSCPSAATAFSYYDAIASSGALSQRTMNRVELARNTMNGFCANPETATVASVLATGAAAYLAVQAALKEARANGAAVGYSGEIRRLDGIMSKLKTELDRAR
jgi:hypothetical protein